MNKYISKSLPFLIISCLLVPVLLAQDAVKLTDRQWLELSLDMIRKGVQQQDASRVMKICAPPVRSPEGGVLSKNALGIRLKEIFSNSSNRRIGLSKPASALDDNPLIASNFWDFDILTPHIDIKGDSAFVECELVLWGAAANPRSDKRGKHAPARFVFFSAPYAKALPGPDEGSTFGGKASRSDRSWQLLSIAPLLDFLEETLLPPPAQKSDETKGEE